MGQEIQPESVLLAAAQDVGMTHPVPEVVGFAGVGHLFAVGNSVLVKTEATGQCGHRQQSGQHAEMCH